MGIIFSIISGCACALGLYPIFISHIVWCGLVPLFFSLHTCSRKAAAGYGFLAGLAFYALALVWVRHVTFLGYIAVCVYLALYWLVFGVGARNLLRKPFSFISVPALWVVLEWAKENVWCGLSWADLGYSQYAHTYFVQAADIFGVKWYSFLIVAVNLVVCSIVLGKQKKCSLKASWYHAAIIALLLVASAVYSVCRLRGLKTESSVSLACVQPNIAEEEKWQDAPVETLVARLRGLSAQAHADSLVIFPEACWPQTITDGRMHALADFVRDLHRPVLMGGVRLTDAGFSNTALHFRLDGHLYGVYRKMKLVPFGEYVPLRRIFSFIPVLNELGDMQKGTDFTIFEHAGKRFGVLICFEDTPPVFAAHAARKTDFLVAITNDEWFRGEPEASQHFGIMVMRAIENRISIARCANTGISGYAEYTGRYRKFSTDHHMIFTQGVWNFTMPLNAAAARSFYARYPDVLVWLCFCLVGIAGMRKPMQ